MTVDEALNAAVGHLQGGRMGEVQALCGEILRVVPGHADAMHILAIAQFHSGQTAAGVESIRKAIAMNPRNPHYPSNLSSMLNSLGRFGEALEAARGSLALQGDSPDVYQLMGVAFHGLGRLAEAEGAFRKTLELRANSPDAMLHLGITLRGMGRAAEAGECYRQALVLRPEYPEALVNLGVILQELRRPEEAVAAYQRALAMRPNFAEAYINLGVTLRNMARPQEAVAAFRQGVALRPDIPEGLMGLAGALRDTLQLGEAATVLQRLVALRPQSAEAHNALGMALNDLALVDEAIVSYRNAIALNPNAVEAMNNLGLALKDAGQVAEALEIYRRALAICDAAGDLRTKDVHSNICYTMHFDAAATAEGILAEHRLWDRKYAAKLRQAVAFGNSREVGRRLRIGYVSPDFRSHVVGNNLVPLFEHHDRKAFEIFCYSDTRSPDRVTERFRACADYWHNVVNVPDEQVAAQVRADGIDILVDLALHMGGNRLMVFARKSAPVQMTFAGYPGTTGLSAIDYRLTDPYLDPPDGSLDGHYVEKSLRLAHSFWCYEALELPAPEVNELPAVRAGVVTFGCFNNFCKINDAVLALWGRVLRAVPGSRLVLLAQRTKYREHTVQVLEQHGVERGRVEILDYLQRRQYLELYNRIDFCLDTFPYNGHTTSLDGLWMGVPTVTLVGATAPARAGWSQLSNLQLQRLAASTADEFVEICVGLVKDLPGLAELRRTLRERMRGSPLMDAGGFARSIEGAYREAWRVWCKPQGL